MRRAHVNLLGVGRMTLDAGESRHLRDVLRLAVETEVELFDDAGNVGTGRIMALLPDVLVEIEAIQPARDFPRRSLTIASAVPKGERADWLVEKLSELGCARWIPLKTDRSVVVPGGVGKRQRWQRIAVESAKQSRRAGVMEIAELMKLEIAMSAVDCGCAFVLATEMEAAPLLQLLAAKAMSAVTFFVGPEGGWTDGELVAFRSAGVAAARLTRTILRVETAAVAAAAIAMVS